MCIVQYHEYENIHPVRLTLGHPQPAAFYVEREKGRKKIPNGLSLDGRNMALSRCVLLFFFFSYSSFHEYEVFGK